MSKLVSKRIVNVELPALAKAILTLQRTLRNQELGTERQVEMITSEFLEAIASSFGYDFGINKELVAEISNYHLKGAVAVHAIDVLGPKGWVSPTTFQYLAPQIRQYIRRNVQGDQWNLVVSERLKVAIHNSINAAQSGEDKLPESLTAFDNPPHFRWDSGSPHLEFSRILLWTKDELLTPIAESVIAIHEAFHVPLFFKEVALESKDRDVDFIFFEQQDKTITGFYGRRLNHYGTEPITYGKIPELGNPVARFWNFIEGDGGAMFAIDARRRLIKATQNQAKKA